MMLSLLTAFSVAITPLGAANAADAADMAKPAQFWWPEQVNLAPLRRRSAESNSLGEDFNYAEVFASLDLDAVKQDIEGLMKTSRDWWPSDDGHYGPFFMRMAWHGAVTYRAADGRGQQRFEPLNS